MDVMIFEYYLGQSDKLGKKWLVRAYNVDDASAKVIDACRDELKALDAETDGDVDVDLKFVRLDEDVVEI